MDGDIPTKRDVAMKKIKDSCKLLDFGSSPTENARFYDEMSHWLFRYEPNEYNLQ